MKILHIVKTAVGANYVYQQVRVLRSLGLQIVVALPSETEGLAPLYRKVGAGVVQAGLDFLRGLLGPWQRSGAST